MILEAGTDPRSRALRARADGLTELHLQHDHVVRDPEVVRHLHGLGLGVAAGTEDPGVAAWLGDLGLDLLCTDRPALLLAAGQVAPGGSSGAGVRPRGWAR